MIAPTNQVAHMIAKGAKTIAMSYVDINLLHSNYSILSRMEWVSTTFFD